VLGAVIVTDKRMRAELAADVARLYIAKKQHAEIGAELDLTKAQVHKILSELFAEGMPKLKRRSMSDRQVRAIHAAYTRGGAPIDRRAEAMGFTGGAARQRMRLLKLPVERQKAARNPARTPAQAEQRMITALLMTKIDELRRARGLSLERLAHACDISMWTLQECKSALSDPRLTTVLRVCRGLGVTPGELLNELPLPIESRIRRARSGGS